MNRQTAGTFFLVFVCGFVLNFVWEFAHAGLYAHYQGGEITRWILLHAALFDASVITALAVPMFFIQWLRARLWLVFFPAILFAIGLEWFALTTGRWEYTAAMPLIPFFGIGLSPMIQLGFTSLVSMKLTFPR